MGGANINWVARGAAIGGHREYAEELLRRGADIDLVARGAAIGGHHEYAQELLGRGADFNFVARGAATGGHLVNDKLTLRFLAFFDQQIIDKLFVALGNYTPITKQGTLVKRAQAISKLMREHSLDYQQAWVKTVKDHLGTMDLLFRLIIKNGISVDLDTFPPLSTDLWYKILSHNTSLTEQKVHELAKFTA